MFFECDEFTRVGKPVLLTVAVAYVTVSEDSMRRVATLCPGLRYSALLFCTCFLD